MRLRLYLHSIRANAVRGQHQDMGQSARHAIMSKFRSAVPSRTGPNKRCLVVYDALCRTLTDVHQGQFFSRALERSGSLFSLSSPARHQLRSPSRRRRLRPPVSPSRSLATDSAHLTPQHCMRDSIRLWSTWCRHQHCHPRRRRRHASLDRVLLPVQDHRTPPFLFHLCINTFFDPRSASSTRTTVFTFLPSP